MTRNGPSRDEQTGRVLQRITIVWNVLEVGITVSLGVSAGSLALIAFGLDSLIEVFASSVVLWHMSRASTSSSADSLALRLVGAAFALLAIYLIVLSARALWLGSEPESSPIAAVYMAVTAIVMFGLARWKRVIGTRLDNAPFLAEARMTLIDGWLATTILLALLLNSNLGWWWSDPLTAIVLAVVAIRESVELFGRARSDHQHEPS